MRKGERPSLVVLVLMVSIIFLGCAGKVLAQQSPPSQKFQVDRDLEETETIVPSPKDIKQATAIYVFVGWMWLSIGALIFFLRQKIKEVDRLHSLKFFSDSKD